MKTSESRYCKCMYFSANALARKIEKLAGDCWKKINLSPSHAYLLMVVVEDPGVQPGARKGNECLSYTKSKRIVSKTEGMQQAFL
jgi:hypothetical protein